MRSLLVGIEALEATGSRHQDLARVTHLLARSFASHVEVLGIEHPPPSAPVMLEGNWSFLEALSREEAEKAGDVFRQVFGIGELSTDPVWIGVVRPEAVGARARNYDLVLLSRPSTDNDGPSRPPVESVLFESGRPLLLVPEWKADVGRRIVISWIDTPESARAVASALPLLKRAEKISILAVKSGRVPASGARGIAGWLAWHGVEAKVIEQVAGTSIAETMLAFATEFQADLLVKGAYTEPRLKRLIFGDTTDYLLSNANLPMWLAH